MVGRRLIIKWLKVMYPLKKVFWKCSFVMLVFKTCLKLFLPQILRRMPMFSGWWKLRWFSVHKTVQSNFVNIFDSRYLVRYQVDLYLPVSSTAIASIHSFRLCSSIFEDSCRGSTIFKHPLMQHVCYYGCNSKKAHTSQ